MNFTQQYAKAEKRTALAKRTRFAKCSINFFIRGRTRMLMIRIKCNGKRSGVRSLGIKLKPGQFTHDTLEIIGDPQTTARLVDLKASILKVFTEREITGRSLDPQVILDIAFGLRGHDDSRPTIEEAMDKWIAQKQQLLGNGIALSSFRHYRRFAQIMRAFIVKYYGQQARLDALKPAVHYELMGYVKGELQLGHNYAIKIIQFLKAVLDYSVAYEWCDRNVLAAVRMNKQKKEVKNLDMEDLRKIAQTEFVETSLNEIRDVFLFCCFSGLAYTDVASLTPDHITTVDGIQCVLKDRQKTGQQSFVPLFPEAIALLERYRTHRICRIKGVCLPVVSNATMNKWLKVIGNIARVKETLHTHLARKTFTMYAEERGFKLEQTSIMMGHSRTSMTEQHYYRQRRETVLKAFKDIQRNDAQELNRQAS